MVRHVFWSHFSGIRSIQNEVVSVTRVGDVTSCSVGCSVAEYLRDVVRGCNGVKIPKDDNFVRCV